MYFLVLIKISVNLGCELNYMCFSQSDMSLEITYYWKILGVLGLFPICLHVNKRNVVKSTVSL